MNKKRILIGFPIYVIGLTVINVLGYSLGFGDPGPIPAWLWVIFVLVSIAVAVTIIAFVGGRFAGRTFPPDKNRTYVTLIIIIVVINVFDSIFFDLLEVRTVLSSIPVAIAAYLITLGILYWRSKGTKSSEVSNGQSDA